MKVRFIKKFDGFRIGDTAQVSPETGKKYIKKGVAIVDRMMDETKVANGFA